MKITEEAQLWAFACLSATPFRSIHPLWAIACIGDALSHVNFRDIHRLSSFRENQRFHCKRLTKPSFRRPVDVMNCGHE
jgi:hypothetical protein